MALICMGNKDQRSAAAAGRVMSKQSSPPSSRWQQWWYSWELDLMRCIVLV